MNRASAVPAELNPPSCRTGALLLHGLTGMPSEMRPLARSLNELGYVVRAPLLPGHGATHRELLATTWRDWLAGARRSLAALASDCDQIVIAGLSMGALLAPLLAVDDARVRGIVLLSPTLRYDGRSIPVTRHLLPIAHLLPFLGRYFYWTERPPYGLKDKRLQRLVTRSIEAAKRGESTKYGLFRTHVGALRQLNLLAREMRRTAPRVRCSALVVHSVEDTVTSVKNALETYRLLGTAEKSILWLTGCDHVITLDLCKEQVSRAVTDFTARIATGTAFVAASLHNV